MMNKTVKIVSILTIMAMLATLSMPVFAVVETSGGLDFNITTPTIGTSDIMEVAGRIIGLIRWVSIIAGVVIITIFGLKYMMGSLEEKAEYKKSFIPLIIGIVVVMTSTTIASLVISTFSAGRI